MHSILAAMSAAAKVMEQNDDNSPSPLHELSAMSSGETMHSGSTRRTHDEAMKMIADNSSAAANSLMLSSTSYDPASPRARFLAGCLQQNLPPRSAIMLRPSATNELNLRHQGMGDDFAELLATGLNSMPSVEVLDISDNNLTDNGLKPLIDSITNNPNIRVLDVSGNVIGPLASSSLALYLGRTDCRLKCLRMCGADVDDSECHRVANALMKNRHLEVVFLLDIY